MLPPERYVMMLHITPGVAEAILVVRNAGVRPGEQLAAIAGLQPPAARPSAARDTEIPYIYQPCTY